MGIGTIMKARKILLIAFGADKQDTESVKPTDSGNRFFILTAVKNELDIGKIVLFTGTLCQCGGIFHI